MDYLAPVCLRPFVSVSEAVHRYACAFIEISADLLCSEQRQDTALSTGQHDIVKAQKPSHSAERKTAAKPDRQTGSSRRDGGSLDKNRAGAAAAAPDGHKTSDKSFGGRSGQKRSRTRSPEKSRMANGISKSQPKLSDAQRAKSSPDAQKSGAKASSLRNGNISAASKDLDKDTKKEWIYADKASACMANAAEVKLMGDMHCSVQCCIT